MPTYKARLPDGTVFEFEGAGDTPTREEYEQARRGLELELSKGMGKTGIPTSRASFMSGNERDILESSVSSSEEVLRNQRNALADTWADRGSAVTAMAGGVTGTAIGAAIGSPAGPPGVAVGGIIGGLVGGAAGAFGGTYGGYAYGPGEAASSQDKFERAWQNAQNDLVVGAALSGAAVPFRVGKNVAKGLMEEAVTSYAGYRSPQILSRVKAAREFGIRLVPADIHPKFAKIYAAIFGNVPLISNPLRAAQAKRAAEIGPIISSLVGPLESGMNEVALGKNFLKSATNAWQTRKDWYKRIFKEADTYLENHPEIRINNDAIDAGRSYIYERARRARPTSSTSTSQRHVFSDISSDVVSGEQRESLRATNAGYDWRFNPDTGQLEKSAIEPGASARDITSGVKSQSARQSTRQAIQVTEEHYTTGGFRSPASVEQFIEDVVNSPGQLTYPQYKGLSDDINQALRVASPQQEATLLQMRENLDAAIDQMGDAGGRMLINRARNTYRQVMEFFENPQAATFTQADPHFARSVKSLNRPGTVQLMPSQLFRHLFTDLSPEGVRNIAKMTSPETMKAAADRYIAEAFESHLKTKATGSTTVDWNALRKELGLNNPTGARYASTAELLKTGQFPWDIGKLSRFVDVMEREVGAEVPELAKMYVRSATLGGPQSALRSLFATTAMRRAGQAGGALTGAKALTLALSLRQISKFLGDPNRLHVVGLALEPSIKSPGVAHHAAKQLIRYLAGDMIRERNGAQHPVGKFELQEEEEKLMGVLNESGMVSEPYSKEPR